MAEETIIERHECWACADRLSPCRVSITFTDGKATRHLRDTSKFIRRTCLAAEMPDNMTDWNRVDEFTPRDKDD